MAEYIKREDAISAACFGCNQQFSDEPCKPSHCSIGQAIMATPPADVVKVRHGFWKPQRVSERDFDGGWTNYTEYKCSECGRTELRKEPYCHCGAKMDGERKEEG